MIYCEDCSSYECGCPERKEIESLHRQLDAKQAEVDALMLEYCPSEMSQEQLDTWAAHQRPSEWKTNDELRQQLAEANHAHEFMSQQYLDALKERNQLRKDVAKLQEALHCKLTWKPS